MKRTIAIIGAAGNMGSHLTRNLANAGYNILAVDADTTALNNMVKKITTGNVQIVPTAYDACKKADIIIPALTFDAQQRVAKEVKDVVTDKIIISIANPVNKNLDGLEVPPESSAAEELQKVLPKARVIKAFNTTFAKDFEQPMIEGEVVDCFVAGDDEDAVQMVCDLVEDAGFNPIIAGKLTQSRTLEEMQALLMALTIRYNYNWHAGFKILH